MEGERDFFGKYGFVSHGVRNLTPTESFELCKEGAVIADIRELYLTVFKMFRVEGVIYLPFSDLERL